MKAKLFIGLASALALAACGQSNDADQATVDTQANDLAVAEPMAEPDPATPQGFVEMAASSDMYEIEAGRLAQDMGQDQAIKDFGAQMVEDHTTSSNNLRTAAGEAGVTVPAAMLPRHQQQLDALRNAGTNFDSVYAEQQVQAHQEALSLLQTQAQSGTAGPLQAFAEQTAPVVEGHLEHARELAQTAGGAGATGTGASAGDTGGGA